MANFGWVKPLGPLVFFLVLLCAPSHAKASEAKLLLSKTFEIHWPASFEASVLPVLSKQGFLITGKRSGSTFTIWTARVEPPTLANTRSVERLWAQNLENVSQTNNAFTNLGCTPVRAHAFRCQRALREATGSHVTESLYWNSKSDLVVVRVMSQVSATDAEEIASLLKIEIQDRLPASGDR